VEAGSFPADSSDDLPQEPGAVLEGPSIGPLPGMGAEKFMQKITVAVLDVDKLKTQGGGPDGGIDEALDKAFYLEVAEDRGVIAHPDAFVKERVAVGDPRLGGGIFMWPGETPGVGELEPDDGLRCRAETITVRIEESRAKTLEAGEGMVGDDELAGIGPPGGVHRDRLASPD
jgi:hypothetical protein